MFNYKEDAELFYILSKLCKSLNIPIVTEIQQPKKHRFVEPWNRCSSCGQFVAYKDFENGKATRKMISIDSDYSTEEYEVLCKTCSSNL